MIMFGESQGFINQHMIFPMTITVVTGLGVLPIGQLTCITDIPVIVRRSNHVTEGAKGSNPRSVGHFAGRWQTAVAGLVTTANLVKSCNSSSFQASESGLLVPIPKHWFIGSLGYGARLFRA